MGECSKSQSFAILDAFYKLGGNFLDTLVGTAIMLESLELTVYIGRITIRMRSLRFGWASG